MNIFCTLFDSNYIDKGLALYYSLERNCECFKLYIFAFDELAESILKDLNLKNAIIIGMKEFETDEMLKVKSERSTAEYCWTCTPITIEYVLEQYKEDICTYIDADLYFFADPSVLLDEISMEDKDILLTEHRFPKTMEGDEAKKKNGKYCVQFNSFKNSEKGMKALKWWKEKCLEWCYYKHEDDRMGDQKYLDNWTNTFEGVWELKHLGGGVAPWNINQYTLLNNNKIILKEKDTNDTFELIFYHFQNLRYLNKDWINIRSQCSEKQLKEAIYLPYLREIERIRILLKKEHDYEVSLAKFCSGNKIVAFIQKRIMKYKITDISDLIDLRKLR